MKIEGDYSARGYALVRELIPPQVAHAFMGIIRRRLLPTGIVSAPPDQLPVGVLKRSVFEAYSEHLPPMKSFLWGLTPAMELVTDRKLTPTYAYFRIYRQGDLCHVHRDREACEHSLSLTLAYGDDKVWPFDVGQLPVVQAKPFADDFGGEAFSTLEMQPGDAVLYQGVTRRHGRTRPNPNRWSAHMFLHWVDRNGPHRDAAFDGKAEIPDRIEFF